MLKSAQQLSTSMSSAASASESNESPFCLSFCDMDDTAVYNSSRTIKNAHLLLPLKLFLSKSPNQLLAMLTNRNSIEETEDADIYKMKQYLADLNSFGIDISPECVIFAGNREVAAKMTEEWHELDSALEVVQKHLQSLRLTEIGQELARTLPAAPRDPMEKSVGPLAKLVAAKFHGKNYHINRFLLEHHQDGHYQFGKFNCAEDALTVIMVVDLNTIAETTKALGLTRFIGIKAPQGGKFPDRVPDYYKINYLLQWADIIGLNHYANSLLESPQDHTEDNKLLQFAGLLFAWQAFPKRVSIEQFYPLVKTLNTIELSQIANMLQYIKTHPNQHKDAGYNPVDDLAELFQNVADDKFLDDYCTQIEQLRLEKVRHSVAASSRPQSPSPEEAPADKPKRGIGSFIKTFSSRSSNNLARRESEVQVKEISAEQAQLEQLVQQERALMERLQSLTLSSNRNLALKASEVLKAARPEEALSYRASASTSSGSSGPASRASSEEFSAIERAVSPPPTVSHLRARSKESGRQARIDSPIQGGPSDDNVMRRISNSKSSAKK